MKYLKNIFFLIVVLLTAINVSGQGTKIKLTVNNQAELTATLVNNSSTAALIGLLKKNALTIAMNDYGNMEKVGSIGSTLPRNDEQITTAAGDLILYQGNALVIYYAPNSWNFTRLGKIDNITQDELKKILGIGSVTVTLKLADLSTGINNYKSGENFYQVYPNPAADYFEVKGQFQTITMTDQSGKVVLRSTENRHDVNHFKPGLYFVKIESGNDNVVTKKISIQ